MNELVDRYRARVGAGVDELVGPAGIRPGHAQVAVALEAMGLGGLLAARAEARRLVHDDGIHYGGPGGGEPSPAVPLTRTPGVGALPEDSYAWRLDPVPVVLDFAQWARLEHGLEQRAVVLEAFEAAWAEVKSRFAGEEDREYAPTKLAGIMRMIARQEIVDCQHLMDAGLVVFERHLD